jgi:hypothetical protein
MVIMSEIFENWQWRGWWKWGFYRYIAFLLSRNDSNIMHIQSWFGSVGLHVKLTRTVYINKDFLGYPISVHDTKYTYKINCQASKKQHVITLSTTTLSYVRIYWRFLQDRFPASIHKNALRKNYQNKTSDRN